MEIDLSQKKKAIKYVINLMCREKNATIKKTIPCDALKFGVTVDMHWELATHA